MAKCKECLHVEVCRYYTNELAKANGIPLKVEEIEGLLECGDCEHFKGRSRFVELPYSLSEGDKLKYIFTDENNEIRIGDDWEVVTKICKDGFFVTGRLNSDGTYQAGDCFYPWSAIGTEYFLTKEAAEQALKEREKDE